MERCAFGEQIGSPLLAHRVRHEGGCIAHGGDGLIAIEVKRTRTIRRADLHALKQFRIDYPMARCALLFGGDRREYRGGIALLPLADSNAGPGVVRQETPNGRHHIAAPSIDLRGMPRGSLRKWGGAASSSSPRPCQGAGVLPPPRRRRVQRIPDEPAQRVGCPLPHPHDARRPVRAPPRGRLVCDAPRCRRLPGTAERGLAAKRARLKRR